jgi:hypothetical protein
MLLAAGSLAVISCIIAEPPTDPPRLPPSRPTIVRGDVIPSASQVLGRLPPKFIVPVELFDPTVTFEWALWVDFNPATGAGLEFFGTSEFEQANTVGRVRSIEASFGLPPDDDRCHVIEVIVALRFAGQQGTGAHAPLDPGGDVVTWFYNPSGDLSGCPVLDAGLEPLPPDSGADAADGAIP